VCTLVVGFQQPQPQSPQDWIRGCIDAEHDKGLR
jgi:hypothetical protein